MVPGSPTTGFTIAVIGATGAVGRELLAILDERKFPIGRLVPFASARSQGKAVAFRGAEIPCEVLQKGCFQGVDIAFFDASDSVSKEWVPEAAAAGAWVIDNSATFRMEPDVPLLVPEVNGALLEQRARAGKSLSPRERIIAGPNCSTVELVVALKPLHDHWGLRRVTVSTYQSTSGAGAAAMEELSSQTLAALEDRKTVSKAFAHRIAFNCIPQIGGFKDDGYTSEEQKIMQETRKILDLPELRINATAIRVPTFSGHGESVNVECDRPVSPEQARAALRAQRGIVVLDDPEKSVYPMNVTAQDDPVEGAAGRDAVYVGRIRRDPSIENGLNFWIVSDNLRKGAALNAVQAGEILVAYA